MGEKSTMRRLSHFLPIFETPDWCESMSGLAPGVAIANGFKQERSHVDQQDGRYSRTS